MYTNFYSSFREFISNYQEDFNNYSSVFPNVTEINFIDEVSLHYMKFLNNGNFYYQVTYNRRFEIQKLVENYTQNHDLVGETLKRDSLTSEEIAENFERSAAYKTEYLENPYEKISLDGLVEIVSYFLLNQTDLEFEKVYRNVFVETSTPIWIEHPSGEYKFAPEDMKFLLPYLEFRNDKGVELNFIKFRDFKFSLERIWNFLIEQKKIILEKGTQDDLNYAKNEKFEPITSIQKMKVGLLIRSGIIEFIMKNNPGINKNKISGFIQELTSESLSQGMVNACFVIEGKNYPIQNKDDEADLDLILHKYGIKPVH